MAAAKNLRNTTIAINPVADRNCLEPSNNQSAGAGILNHRQKPTDQPRHSISLAASVTLPVIGLLALMAGSWLAHCPPARAVGAAPATATSPPRPPAGKQSDEKLARFTLSASGHSFTMPAAFWNEHLANWLDVALCGRPSNFLHETVLSIVATRSMLMRNMQKIGFHPAMQWAPNLKDFTINRGEPVLILVRFKLHGKIQTWPLEELISLRGWHVAIGPFGWLYLGNPSPFKLPASVRAVHGGQSVSADTILMDDPQIAMQFRGLRHESQSLLNFPLSADNWIYPNIRYHRNMSRVPQTVFDSNGRVKVTLEFKRVSEVEYLRAVGAVWKNRAFARYIHHYLPLAKRIDRCRESLWKAWHVQHKNWQTSGTIMLDQAEIARCYTALDAAWIDWDVKHAHFAASSGKSAKQIQQQAMLFDSHLDQKRSQYHQLWLAAQCHALLNKIKSSPLNDNAKASAARTKQIHMLESRELAAQSRALLDGNLQHLNFWQQKQHHIKPTDPRKNWLADIAANLALAQARRALGQIGLQYADALAHNHGTIKLQKAYIAAILTVSLRQQQVALVQVDFRIAEDKGFVSAAHMARLTQHKARIKKSIHAIQDQIKLLTEP